ATSSASGNDVQVTLGPVGDNKRVSVTIDGVNGNAAPLSASIGFLVGDVTNSRSVSASDISAVKARVGQPIGLASFRFDVNTNGSISAQDVSMVKARAGQALP
ncbi:MAG: dockerin type I domain-containing protein, partial [Betaproteobacteria bacterium]